MKTSETPRNDVVLTWDRPMTSSAASEYHLTAGFVAVELFHQLERDLAAERAKREAAERDRDAYGELLALHNLGGWTDFDVGPIKRALVAEARASDAAVVAYEEAAKICEELREGDIGRGNGEISPTDCAAAIRSCIPDIKNR